MVHVIVNQWLGDGPRYPNCYCWSCRRPATVAEIADPGGALLVRLCGTCLHEAQQAISLAILEDCKRLAAKKEPYLVPGSIACPSPKLGIVRTDSDDDGYPD